MDETNQILQALKFATDQNPSVFKPAEELLKKLECNADFHVVVSQLCHSYEIEWTVRWLAVVYLKNGIDKFWRGERSLDEDKKAVIRENLLRCLEEPVQQIAVQVAVMITKVARLDYPKDWPDLILFLMSGLLSDKSILQQRRSLLSLKHVIKMLSTKCLLSAKKIFSQVCDDVFENVCRLWISVHEGLKQNLDLGDKDNITSSLENGLLLTRLVTYMVGNCKESDCRNLFEILFKKLPDDISIAQRCFNYGTTEQNISAKNVIGTIKILESVLKINSDTFKIGAYGVIDILCKFLYSNVEQRILSDWNEKLLIKCMNAIRYILHNDVFEKVFPEDILVKSMETLFQCLLFHYLPLKEENIKCWEDDPESFFNQEEGEAWKFSLRPSTEILLQNLLNMFPQNLVPMLLNILDAIQEINFQNIVTLQSTPDLVLQKTLANCTTPFQCMLRKEAVYYMVGLSLTHVSERIEFEKWFCNKLMPEVNSAQSEPHGKLIHRIVLWLISQFAELSPSNALRPTLYGFVVSSMSPTVDLAVRLAAASAVQALLDDFEFDLSVFKEQQDACIEGLYSLLVDVENCETKMRVLNVISYLIERLGERIVPYEAKIAGFIPHLWDHATTNSHDMLKCSIVCMMVQFVHALGPKSLDIHHLALPIITESSNLHHASHIYLLEDGLDLWLAILHHSLNINPILYSLLDNVYGLLECGSETLKICFQIIEAYAMLLGQNLMSSGHGSTLDRSLFSLSTDVRDECLVLISRLVNCLFQVTPPKTTVCMTYCQDAIKRIFSDKDSVLLSANITLVARFLLHNPNRFWEVCQHFCSTYNQEFVAMIVNLIKIWCNNIDIVIDIHNKKLSALALLTTLNIIIDIPQLTCTFEDIICVVVQILYDVCDKHYVDMLMNECEKSDSEHYRYETAHDKRKRLLNLQSPSCRVSLPAFASERLKNLQERMPELAFTQMMSTVNQITMKELEGFLSAC